MDRFINAIKLHAGALDSRIGQARMGTVTSVNTNNCTARVALQPEGIVTGWLPVSSSWTGDGWGFVAPLQTGEQVLVVPQEGNGEHGVIIGRLFSERRKPPVAPVGELWIVHRSGTFLKLLNDGTVRVHGDLHVDGDIFDRKGSLDHLRGIYNRHRHHAPHGDTSEPFAQDDQ